MKKLAIIIIGILLLLQVFPQRTFATSDLEWTSVEDIPENRTASAIAEVNGIIYIFGGSTAKSNNTGGQKQNTTYAYNPATNTWVQKTNMPTERAAVSAAVYEDKVYLIGGYYDKGGNLARTNKIEVYEPSTDSWTTVADMLQARSWAGAGILDNMIYVVGGATASSDSKIVATVERYDIANNKWTKLKDFPAKLNGMSLETVNGKMYAFGGGTGFSKGMSANIYEYNVSNDSWIKRNTFKIATSGAASTVYNGEIYVMGGQKDTTIQSRVEIFNPDTNEIRPFTSLTSPRNQSVAATVGGDIFIFGGTSGNTILSTAQKISMMNEQPTPEQPSGSRAILVVTMTTGLEKEFDLSMKEVNDFIAWYEAKQAGTGKASYAINKHDNNRGPFNSRKEYILYDRVLTFEVSEY